MRMAEMRTIISHFPASSIYMAGLLALADMPLTWERVPEAVEVAAVLEDVGAMQSFHLEAEDPLTVISQLNSKGVVVEEQIFRMAVVPPEEEAVQ